MANISGKKRDIDNRATALKTKKVSHRIYRHHFGPQTPKIEWMGVLSTLGTQPKPARWKWARFENACAKFRLSGPPKMGSKTSHFRFFFRLYRNVTAIFDGEYLRNATRYGQSGERRFQIITLRLTGAQVRRWRQRLQQLYLIGLW